MVSGSPSTRLLQASRTACTSVTAVLSRVAPMYTSELPPGYASDTQRMAQGYRMLDGIGLPGHKVRAGSCMVSNNGFRASDSRDHVDGVDNLQGAEHYGSIKIDRQQGGKSKQSLEHNKML